MTATYVNQKNSTSPKWTHDGLCYFVQNASFVTCLKWTLQNRCLEHIKFKWQIFSNQILSNSQIWAAAAKFALARRLEIALTTDNRLIINFSALTRPDVCVISEHYVVYFEKCPYIGHVEDHANCSYKAGLKRLKESHIRLTFFHENQRGLHWPQPSDIYTAV